MLRELNNRMTTIQSMTSITQLSHIRHHQICGVNEISCTHFVFLSTASTTSNVFLCFFYRIWSIKYVYGNLHSDDEFTCRSHKQTEPLAVPQNSLSVLWKQMQFTAPISVCRRINTGSGGNTAIFRFSFLFDFFTIQILILYLFTCYSQYNQMKRNQNVFLIFSVSFCV